MDAVTFIGFIAIFFQILEPAKRLSAAISNMQGGIPAVQRVLEVLDYDLKVEEIANRILLFLSDRVCAKRRCQTLTLDKRS
jgi:subfamily B ATP-binding cassette protein MsbA